GRKRSVHEVVAELAPSEHTRGAARHPGRRRFSISGSSRTGQRRIQTRAPGTALCEGRAIWEGAVELVDLQHAVMPELQVKVRAGRQSGAADPAHELTGSHRLPDGNSDG